MATVETNIKDEARRIIDELPNNATWKDLMYEIYVRERIEQGIRDMEAQLRHHRRIAQRTWAR
jgi:hypothetical protein